MRTTKSWRWCSKQEGRRSFRQPRQHSRGSKNGNMKHREKVLSVFSTFPHLRAKKVVGLTAHKSLFSLIYGGDDGVRTRDLCCDNLGSYDVGHSILLVTVEKSGPFKAALESIPGNRKPVSSVRAPWQLVRGKRTSTRPV